MCAAMGSCCRTPCCGQTPACSIAVWLRLELALRSSRDSHLPPPTTLTTALQLYGYRRVFAHTADIFFQRGIANAATVSI